MTEPVKERVITRRRLLGEAAAGAGTVVLFGGCLISPDTPLASHKAEFPTSQLAPRASARPTQERTLTRLPELTQQDIDIAAKQAVRDFSTVLGIPLPEDFSKNVVLVMSLEDYQKIIAGEEVGYVPNDELTRIAVATESTNPYGHKIFLYKGAVDHVSRSILPNERGRQGRIDHIEHVLVHELAHFVAKEYRSDELFQLVYGKMLANHREIKGKHVDQDIVVGAEIKVVVDEVLKSPFDNLEEAEATIIQTFVTRKRGRPQLASAPTAEDIGVKAQFDLLSDLVRRLGNDPDEHVKKLATLRMEEGGREIFARSIGERYTIPQADQLFFGMSVLYVINIGDRRGYEQLVNRPVSPNNK